MPKVPGAAGETIRPAVSKVTDVPTLRQASSVGPAALFVM
jgi:hypothetical protein